jgi:hypothetical protein
MGETTQEPPLFFGKLHARIVNLHAQTHRK